MRSINEIIIHCSATREGQEIPVETIKKWHTEGRGWTDIGYHFYIELDGTIKKGRDINKNMNEKETPSFYHFLLKPSISLTFQKQKVSITFLFSFLVVDKYFQSIHRNYFLSIAWLVHLIFLLCHCNLLIDT